MLSLLARFRPTGEIIMSSQSHRRGGSSSRRGGSIIMSRMSQQNRQRTSRSTVTAVAQTQAQPSDEKPSGSRQQMDPGRDQPSTSNEGARPRSHPPHLRGKEIGMWYASASRSKSKAFGNGERKVKEKIDPKQRFGAIDKSKLLRITLNADRQFKIQDLLEKLEDTKYESSVVSAKSSQFQQNYVQNVRDNQSAASSSIKIPGLLFDVNSILEIDSNGQRINCPIPLERSRNRNLDNDLYDELQAKMSNSQYRKMLEFRQKLPTHDAKDEILDLILQNQIIVVEGQTGCGKTTQIPQFILDRWISDGNGSICNILCTQPRRISAVGVAERVAQERSEIVGGKSIGYSIRLEGRLPKGRGGGTLIFCTTGILFQHLKSDPFMNHVSHLIVDEIHERDVLSDFLLAMIKDLMAARPDLKVVLMSATINAQHFADYFDNCPIFHIPGLTFPVEEFYLEDVIEKTKFQFPLLQDRRNTSAARSKKGKPSEEQMDFDVFIRPYLKQLEKSRQYSPTTIKQLSLVESEAINMDLIQALIEDICVTDKQNGAILVFVPGWDNISKLHQQLADCPHFSKDQFEIIPLHSLMPTINQRQIFNPPPPGKRKIVIATNIAETSITIEDIIFVIDCGKIKMTNFDVAHNIETLGAEWVSRANATQRRGRAGRTQPGVCFRLYSRAREEVLEDFKKPEVLRKGLQEEILRIKVLKLGKAAPFFNRLMDPPSPETIQLAIKRLRQLHALDENENLTPLGFHLSQLPMDPQSGRLILMGAIFSCCDPILSIAASLSFKDPFYVPLGKEEEVDRIRKELSGMSKSDHIALINAMEGYEFAKITNSHREFCYTHFLSSNTLNLLENLKGQFASYLKDLGFLKTTNYKDPSLNINSKNLALIKAILCAGLYPNVAKVKMTERGKGRRMATVFTEDDGRVSIHPKSVNYNETSFESPFLVYHHKMKSTSIFLHDTTMISPFPLIFFGGELDHLDASQTGVHASGSVGVDGNIRFLCKEHIYNIIEKLRNELDDLLDFKVQHPGPTNWNALSREGPLLQAITEVITAEYKALMDVESYSDSDDEYLLPNPDL